MILLLCIISLCLWIYNIGKAAPGIHAVKLAALALFAFFCLYTVVSAFFFWEYCFCFSGTLLVCVILQAGLAAALIWRCAAQPLSEGVDRSGAAQSLAEGADVGSAAQSLAEGADSGCVANAARVFRLRVSFDAGRYWIPIVIALLALPFTWNKFELYSMGQDQGTYQVKALALMEYDTHNYMEMEEFTRLNTPEERQKYLDFVYSQNNLYLPRVEWETDTDASHFESIVGTIHGLPTYSALLALWGKLFGYENMIGVQTLLYLCVIFLTYFVCENMKLKKGTAAFVTLMTAASPIVLWLSKSSLTEIGILLLVCAFLYFLTGETYHQLCMAPIIVFAFFHISLYAFMPVFIIVLALMYISRRDGSFLTAMAGSAAGYWLGAVWAFMIAPYYSYGNYSELGRITGGLLGEKTLIPLITCVCLAIILLCALLLGSGRAERQLFSWLDALAAKRLSLEKAAYWLMRIFLIMSVLFFVYRGVLQGETTTACEYLQISTYIYMSGILMIPMIYIALFCAPRRLLKNDVCVSLVILFLYCVVMYSMVMRVKILYYYYFARYAALFLPVIFLLGALVLEQLDKRAAIALSAVMLLTFLPYDKGFVRQKDHTRCEWEFLGDICEEIGSGDAFIVGPEEQQIVFIFPVKLLTGCDVYYADEKLDTQLAALAESYEHVYYMDYDTAFEDSYGDSAALEALHVSKIYTNWNHLSYLDYFNITNPLTPIPLNYVEYKLKLSLYEIGKEVLP